MELDPQVLAMTKAIRQVESGGKFDARSKDGSYGAYQFIKPTWDATAKKYGVNAKWEEATPQQQNEVAYKQIKEWKDKGWNVGQVASAWNAGAGRPNAYLEGLEGTNKDGVKYNVTKYAEKVRNEYQKLKGQTGSSSVAEEAQATSPKEGFLKGVAKDLIKPFARLGTNVINAGQALAGKEQTQPFSGGFLGQVKAVGQEGTFGEKLKDSVGAGLQVASNLPIGKSVRLTAGALKTAVQNKALLPTLGKAVKPLFTEGALAGGTYGSGKALEEQKSTGGVIKGGALGALGGAIAAPVIGLGLPGLARGVKNVPKIKGALTPNPENIMNRVARLTPIEANNFKKMTGESHGAYLERTGNFGNPQEIIEKEAKKFIESRGEVDIELAKLPGVFKSKELDTVLEDLVKREAEIGVPNEESRMILSLYNKNKKQNGLSMEDGNIAKRLYERNVKLGYQKENNTIGVARATRLDDALRKWQFETANKLGLKNLDKLNKQTQASKFIVDKLGKQISGKTGNDAISLTDIVLLSGGDPTAATMFLTKKLLLSKRFLAGLAKTVSKKSPTGALKAEFGGKTGLPALIKDRDYGTTIEMGGKKSPTTYEKPATKTNRSSSLKEQLLLSAPKSSSQGKPIILPRSARETNLGLDEVRNLKRQLEALRSKKKNKS